MKFIDHYFADQQPDQKLPAHQYWEAVLTILLFALYLISFASLYPILGDFVTAFTCIPVVTAAWFFGRKTAYQVSLAIAIFSLVLVHVFDSTTPFSKQILMNLIGLSMLIVISFLTGWASETRRRLQRELNDRRQIEMDLLESVERYRMLFEDATDPIIIHSPDGQLMEMNGTAARLLGYSLEELTQLSLTDMIEWNHAILIPEQIQQILQNGAAIYEVNYMRKDGEILPFEVNARVISYQGKQAIFSIARDITQRKAIEAAEREQRAFAEALRSIAANLTGTLRLEEVLDRILDNLSKVVKFDAATIMLVEGEVARVSRNRGYSDRGFSEAVKNIRFPIDELFTLRTMRNSNKALVISDLTNEPGWVPHPTIEWAHSFAGAPIHIKGTTIGFLNVNSAEPGFFSQAQAERLQAFADHAAIAIHNARLYEEVQQMALVDELTGIYNRRGLQEIGQREVERAIRFKRPLAAVMIDIDHFKQFNDQYSYDTGDQVLATFAQRCRSTIRKVDLVCRYGGDEFIILLTENTQDTACIVAEHIRQAIECQPFDTGEGPVRVTASFGVSACGGDICDLPALISSAGHALQHAKQSGRNQVTGAAL